MGDLAERLQLRHNSVVELIDRLAGHGLVQRSRAGADRRQVSVRLTRKGEAVLHKLSRDHRAELQSVGRELAAALQAIVARKRVASSRRETCKS